MQQSQPRALLTLWGDLCHVFRCRIQFIPQRGEVRASFFNYGNDQINWHRQHIKVWHAATEMLRPLPTPTLLSLLNLARENRTILEQTVKFNSKSLVFITTIATFGYTAFMTVSSHLFSPAEFWNHHLNDPVYPSLFGVTIATILLLNARHWLSMHQSREIKSCIQVVLAERYYEEPENHRPSVA
ncbi:MAG: hypothetical protein OXE86_16460 [Alphaproteobacteria bacterium]|nr:hypothetical protein [Alphaproteobacteria bacterium]